MVKGRKRGRPRKLQGDPVEHRLTPKMRIAITAIVEEGKRIDEAAAAAGLTASAVYKGMKHAPAQAFYIEELKNLRLLAKARALNVLIREMETGTNAAARVSAARSLLADTDAAPLDSRMPQAPGFSFLIVDARGQQAPAVAGPVINGIAHQAKPIEMSADDG